MTGWDDADVTHRGNLGRGRDWCIAGMRERGRKSFSVHVEVREVEISVGRIAVVVEVRGGLRINRKGGRRGKLEAGGGEKTSRGHSGAGKKDSNREEWGRRSRDWQADQETRVTSRVGKGNAGKSRSRNERGQALLEKGKTGRKG